MPPPRPSTPRSARHAGAAAQSRSSTSPDAPNRPEAPTGPDATSPDAPTGPDAPNSFDAPNRPDAPTRPDVTDGPNDHGAGAASRLSSLVSPSQRVVISASVALLVASGGLVAAGAADIPRFVVSALALAALAGLVGEFLEQLGRHLRPGPTGLIQASLGNLPELLVAIFALRAGLTTVVQAALIGSVLANLLLVLGLAFLTGAARHGTQAFEPEAPRMTVALLTLAVGSLAVPTLAARLDTPAAHHTAGLSQATAVVLLVVYIASIPFWLSRGAPEPKADRASRRAAEPKSAQPVNTASGLWPLWLVVIILAAAAGATAAVSDWFVSALEPATKTLGISPAFTGLVIVAIASNAVENAAGVRFAWRARPDYAISTILNSPLQIALLLTPFLVLLSPALGPTHLLLVFPPLLVSALAIATVTVAIIVYDGEYSWLEGVSLMALYAIVASALWWG